MVRVMATAFAHALRRCGRSFHRRLPGAGANPAVWPVLNYRLRRRVAAALPRPVRWPPAALTVPLQVALGPRTRIRLSPAADVGPGRSLPHLGTIVFGSGSTVRRNWTIAPNGTIRHSGGRAHAAGAPPVIGDRADVAPGAIVIGPITDGDDALIGAGAVVVTSVPPRGVAAGTPTRLASRGGSFALIEYNGMDPDPARRAALKATP